MWSSVSYPNRTMPTHQASATNSNSSVSATGAQGVDQRMSIASVYSSESFRPYSTATAGTAFTTIPVSSTSTVTATSDATGTPRSSTPVNVNNLVTNNTHTKKKSNNRWSSACENLEPPRPRSLHNPNPNPSNNSAPPVPPSFSSSSSPYYHPHLARALRAIGNRSSGAPTAPAPPAVAVVAATTNSFQFLKSPTTLTFERMIEACTYHTFSTLSTLVCTALRSILSDTLSPALYISSLTVAAELIAENPALMKKAKRSYKKRSNAKPTALLGDGTSTTTTTASKSKSSAFSSDLDDPIEEIQADEDLHRRVVLLMALQRQPAENHADVPPSPVIREGFFWKTYPVCEQVLYDAMADYYQLSCLQRQSKLQQEFNNALVERMRTMAQQSGVVFEPTFSDKKLRDRIRCFFKTHQQNAKKRLVTLIKHADSPEHLAALRFMIHCVRQGRSLDEMQGLEDLPKKIRGKERPSMSMDGGRLV
jgi:hypothetical protein